MTVYYFCVTVINLYSFFKGVGNNLLEEHDIKRQIREAPTASVGDFTAPPTLLEISARAVTTGTVVWKNQNIPRHLEGRYFYPTRFKINYSMVSCDHYCSWHNSTIVAK